MNDDRNPSPENGDESPAAVESSDKSKEPSESVRRKFQEECFDNTWAGSVAAGMLYPFFLSGGLVVFQLIDAIAGLHVCAMLVGVGMVVGAISGAVGVFIVCEANQMLGHPLSGRYAGITAGSLSGYMSTCWVCVAVLFQFSIFEFTLACLLGPVLASTMSAAGAYWVMKRNVTSDESSITPAHWRLSVSHLLMAMLMFSLLLAVSSPFGAVSVAVALCVSLSDGWCSTA